VPFDARRRLERGVADVAGLLTEDRAEQLLFGSELRLALRRDFADEDVALLDGRADADDAALVEIAQRDSLTFGMSRVISSGPSLVSRASISNSSMWIEV
jgi:hypothetical protein